MGNQIFSFTIIPDSEIEVPSLVLDIGEGTFADAQALCAKYDCKIALSDAAGFVCGWATRDEHSAPPARKVEIFWDAIHNSVIADFDDAAVSVAPLSMVVPGGPTTPAMAKYARKVRAVWEKTLRADTWVEGHCQGWGAYRVRWAPC